MTTISNSSLPTTIGVIVFASVVSVVCIYKMRRNTRRDDCSSSDAEPGQLLIEEMMNVARSSGGYLDYLRALDGMNVRDDRFKSVEFYYRHRAQDD